MFQIEDYFRIRAVNKKMALQGIHALARHERLQSSGHFAWSRQAGTWLLLVLMSVLPLIGCTAPSWLRAAFRSPGAAPTRIPTAPGIYHGVAWLPGDWLVTHYEPEQGLPHYTWQLWRVRPDGSGMEVLPLPQDPACARTRYGRPTTLPDGRLGLRKWCISEHIPGQPVGPGEFSLMGYDLTTGILSPLVASPVRLGISQFTWHPSMERGMVGSSSQICASIAWLTRQGVEYPNIVVGEGRQRWNLAEHFRRDAAQPCTDQGRADLPAWSPDGQQIAFFASPQSIGTSGQARLDRPWNLYLMDPQTQEPRLVRKNVPHPRGLAWSPDGQWLAFSVQTGRNTGELWLYAPASGTLRHVTSAPVSSIAWSPDGTHIASVLDRFSGSWPPDTQLVRIDVQPFLTQR